MDIFDRFPRPPCADLLGWTLLDHDAARGWAKLGFEGRREFLNPAGFVQGGFLSAMLDDAMGPAVLIASGGALYTATINMNVSFLAPAKPGRFTAEATVLRMGKTVAFTEASLFDAGAAMVARASASVRLVPVGKLSA
jgi:uncharacterized protein (TIGR00369 family)